MCVLCAKLLQLYLILCDPVDHGPPGSSVHGSLQDTAYLELFLRSISEPALLRTFLRFLLLHRHDTHTILDTLVARIGSNSRVWPLPLSWLTWVSHLLSPTFVLGGCFCPSLAFVSSNHFKVRWHFLSSIKLLTILGTFSMCFPAFVISGYT